MRRALGITGVAAVLATSAAASAGSEQSATYNLTANLAARFEVPRPSGVSAGATGVFTGRAVELRGNRARVTWRLTYRRLSGRALAAHIHVGRPGKAGKVLAPLCGPCRSGQRGTATISRAQLRTIRSGAAYVNIHTARNQAGEIRGQIRARRSGTSPTPPPTDPSPPPPEPPPYP